MTHKLREDSCLHLLVVVIASLVTACGDPMPRCHGTAPEVSQTVEICAQAWRQEQDAGAAVRVAEGLVSDQRFDEAMTWIDGLPGAGLSQFSATQFSANQRARLHKAAASASLRLGDEGRAKEEYGRALDLFDRLEDDLERAKCHYGLFYLHWRGSQLGPALLHADAAASAARRVGDQGLEAKALRGLLALQVDLGDLQGARRTLAVSRAAVDDPSTLARLLVVEGTLLANEGRPALAVDAFQRALGLATGSEEAAFWRSLHLNLTAAHLELGQLEPAAQHLRAARQTVDAGDGVAAVPTAIWFHQAELELRQGQPEAALESLTAALEDEPIADWRWQLDEMRGRAFEALGRLDASEAAYQTAVETVEGLRSDLDFGELRSWLLDAKRRPYERLFELQVGDGRLVDALTTVERAKARSFLDAFVHATDPEQGASTEEVAGRLEGLRDLLPILSAAPIARPEPMARVLDAVADLDILLYFQTPAGLWGITVTEGRPRMDLLTRGRATLDEAIDDWLAQPENAVVGTALADLMLPGRLLPPEGRRLFVVTDGRLGEVPLAALPVAGEPLIRRHELVLTPSLNALVELRRTASERPPTSEPALVLGDPLGDLPAARREAQWVAETLGVKVHLGADATSDLLTRGDGVQAPALLHVASHLGTGSSGPWIALADGRLSTAEILSLGSARTGPRLVVLAGCAGAARQGSGLWGSPAASFLAAGSAAVLASLWSVEDTAARRFIERFYIERFYIERLDAEGGAVDAVSAVARAQRDFLDRGEPLERWAPFVVLGGGLDFPPQAKKNVVNRPHGSP